MFAEPATARMTDEYFFRTALNLDHPGLGPVRDAVNGGDFDQARAEWARHVRTRKGIPEFFPTADMGPRFSRNPRPYGDRCYRTAERILSGDRKHWSYGVSANSRYNCIHLKSMAHEYRKTKNEIFPRAFVQ
ncbi:MAG: heparinase II/III family protein, partial [Planctomycetota bacterium]